MPNIKSSKKAVKVIAKKTDANHELKQHGTLAIHFVGLEEASKIFKDFQKTIDKALQKGLVKENKVDREKQRLNAKIKNMK